MENSVVITQNEIETGRQLRLWYSRPAEYWTEALPIGNGRLGAMIFGKPGREQIQFNEETLWTGSPHCYDHPGAADYLPQIREMLSEGKQQEAEALAMEHFMSIPLRQENYQAFGSIGIECPTNEGVKDYHRELDLDTGIVSTSYRTGESIVRCEAFASAPDDILLVRWHVEGPEPPVYGVSLECPHEHARVQYNERASAIADVSVSGQMPNGGLRYHARADVLCPDGTVHSENDRIIIEGASDFTLHIAAATSFRSFRDISGDPVEKCGRALVSVCDKHFSDVRRAHIEDHRKLFRRMSFDLGDSPEPGHPTDAALKNFSQTGDPELAALYFQYGRYLLIASSRPGTQAANLQGIWNDQLEPPWGSKWTTNINCEMNYWPAEICNLSECHEPLFDLLRDVSIAGACTAKTHYNCGGWVLHHNTDLWRGTAPINNSNHGIWPTGGAWLCHHLWERYLFTLDKRFLADRAYPIIKGAALFFMDYLIEDPSTGWLISTPSNSPEQGGLVAGPAMDHQIIRDLFLNSMQAAEILDIDAEFRKMVSIACEKIAPNQIGRHGQLQEWLEDKDDPDNKHRHVSHMWGLHPGFEIDREETPELAEAAKKSMEFRGDGGTGWSMGWKINLWARLGDGDRAYRMLANQLSYVDPAEEASGAGGTYPNLFDAHPPFQIDGNFGATAAIAELLMQSRLERKGSGFRIDVLPALPSRWKNGKINGLRARGGFEVDIVWKNGTLSCITVKSLCGSRCRVQYAAHRCEMETETGRIYDLNGRLERISETK